MKKYFSYLDVGFLVRSYLFSGAMFLLCLKAFEGQMSVLLIICALLYPLADLLWRDIANMLMGDNIYVLPLFIMLGWKALRMLLLFFLSPLIAPIGLAYVMLRSKLSQN